MSEHTALPKATQSLSTKDVVQRWAVCPRCKKRSSLFIAPSTSPDGKPTWLFSCKFLSTKGNKVDHIFAAAPDRSAPKTVEEMPIWLTKMKAARAGLTPTKSQS